jgi:hypothetical protein
MPDRNQQPTDQQRMQRERNALAQGTGPEPFDFGALNEKIKAEYAGVEQPGLHPANRPGNTPEGERDPHKTTRDLEDITGNPGHRNVNPNAPATSINPAPGPELISINEPPGSNVLASIEGEGEAERQRRQPQQSIDAPKRSAGTASATQRPAQDTLDLIDLEPDSIVVGSAAGFELTLTGTGFTEDCIVVVDDEEQQTTYVSDTKLTAWVAVGNKPATVDVEVARGEDLSDVLTFEFTQAPRSRKQPERKPKKSTPSHKRLPKGRSR